MLHTLVQLERLRAFREGQRAAIAVTAALDIFSQPDKLRTCTLDVQFWATSIRASSDILYSPPSVSTWSCGQFFATATMASSLIDLHSSKLSDWRCGQRLATATIDTLVIFCCMWWVCICNVMWCDVYVCMYDVWYWLILVLPVTTLLYSYPKNKFVLVTLQRDRSRVCSRGQQLANSSIAPSTSFSHPPNIHTCNIGQHLAISVIDDLLIWTYNKKKEKARCQWLQIQKYYHIRS